MPMRSSPQTRVHAGKEVRELVSEGLEVGLDRGTQGTSMKSSASLVSKIGLGVQASRGRCVFLPT